MKKTIAALALAVSASSAHALIGPEVGGPNQPQPQVKKYCLSVYDSAETGKIAFDCDQTERNQMSGVKLKQNGCAKGQIAIESTEMVVPMCPTFAQL